MRATHSIESGPHWQESRNLNLLTHSLKPTLAIIIELDLAVIATAPSNNVTQNFFRLILSLLSYFFRISSRFPISILDDLDY